MLFSRKRGLSKELRAELASYIERYLTQPFGGRQGGAVPSTPVEEAVCDECAVPRESAFAPESAVKKDIPD